jgi:hypothetical protein
MFPALGKPYRIPLSSVSGAIAGGRSPIQNASCRCRNILIALIPSGRPILNARFDEKGRRGGLLLISFPTLARRSVVTRGDILQPLSIDDAGTITGFPGRSLRYSVQLCIPSIPSPAKMTDGFRAPAESSTTREISMARLTMSSKMSRPGTFRGLYDFCQLPECAEGENPSGGVVMDVAGNLYGTNSNRGVIRAASTRRMVAE